QKPETYAKDALQKQKSVHRGQPVQPFFLPDLKESIRGHEEIASKELRLFLVVALSALFSWLFSKHVLMHDQVPKLMGCARYGALNSFVAYAKHHQAHLILECAQAIQAPPIVVKEETAHPKIFEHSNNIVWPTVTYATAF